MRNFEFYPTSFMPTESVYKISSSE